MFARTRSWLVLAVAGWSSLGLVGAIDQAAARMTVLYDVNASMQLLLGTQPDGSPGLRAEDGIYQQVTLGPLPVDRQLGALTGGVGSLSTPSIRDLAGPAIAALVREEVDTVGAHLMFIDIGPDYDSAGPDGQNLGAAMAELAATPYVGGGSYADRVHLYVSRAGDIADPASREAFWQAMALSGGVWLEAYQGRVQWPVEYWLAWPRALRDGLVARGMHPSRLHIIVRGADQAATWANLRTGVACEFLANGPGAYRIEDHAGFVREFRATFGAAPAPTGPSPVACQPPPTVGEPLAGALAEVLAAELGGRRMPNAALSALIVTPGRPRLVSLRLGSDPFGLAASLRADPRSFWADARARVRAIGPGIDVVAPVTPDGVAYLALAPIAHGPITLTLEVDGLAIRRAMGAPIDFAATLAVYRARISPVLNRMTSNPVDWQLRIPLSSTLRSAAPPPKVSVRVVRRRVAPRVSLVELRLSRPAKRLLIEVGGLRGGRVVPIRRLRITGRRIVVPIRLSAGQPVRARVIVE